MKIARMTLQPLITLSAAAIAAASGVNHGSKKTIGSNGCKRLLAALHVAAHDNTDTDETYQFNLTTGCKLPSGQDCWWDIGAFVVVSGADAVVTQLMFVNGEASEPTTTIADGTVTKIAPNHSLGTDFDTRGTITTAVVRHGFIGDWLGYTLESGGTTAGPIQFEMLALLWS
jgi:hypothetical protein